MLKTTCSICKAVLDIPDHYAGQSGKCNKCGKTIANPAAPAALKKEITTSDKWVVAVVLIFAVFWLSFWLNERAKRQVGGTPPPDISLSQFHQIKKGMGYEDVVTILGAPGVEMSSTKSENFSAITYQWRVGYSFCLVIFQNGEVVSMMQRGLE